MLRWKSTRRNRRHFAILGAFTFLSILFILVHHHDSINSPATRSHARFAAERSFNPLASQHARFWKLLHGLMINNHPRCNKKPDPVIPREPDLTYDPEHRHPRPDVLWMDEADIERMRAAHSNFVADIRTLSASLAYNPGTRGIVTTASQSSLAILSISLRMLRKAESTLPVEIFLNSPSPYTETFCSRVFPQLNAECRYLSDIFSAAETSVHLNTYQYKIFAILFSSFEDILHLDSDAWPITNPDSLFHSLPFTDTGMVLWPDFWYPSESPYFFDIAKINNIPPLNARASTESGEILYSKSQHALSIMLAAYYNYYGPDYYWILQSQGGQGQGDKETFPWAATALGEEFYSVKHPVGSLGRHDSNGEYIGTAMVQYDPVADFFVSQAEMERKPPIKNPEDIAHPETPMIKKLSLIRPLFVHANFPKFDPYTIFDDEIKGVHTPTRDSNGSWVRCWGSIDEAIALFGFDLERRFWEAMEEAACGDLLGLWLGGARPDRGSLEAVRKRDMLVCERVRKYIQTVFDDKNGGESKA